MATLTGARIRERRKELGLTADKLAKIIGVSRATMFRYESGDIEAIPSEALYNIATTLHTTVDYLLGETRNPSANKLTKRQVETISMISRLSDESCDLLVPVIDVLLRKQFRAESLLQERETLK